MKVQEVATSGVAALLLKGGRTAHSTFKVPNTLADDSVFSISIESAVGKELTDLDMVV